MMYRLRLLVVMLAAVAAGMSSACTSTSSSTSTSVANAPTTYTSITTVADVAKQLEAKGIPCKLEYEGLKDNDKTLSICTIDGSQATLAIWDKPEVLQKFLAGSVVKGATAVGANWTIDVDNAPTAQKIATALGGTVKSSSPGTTK